MKFIGTLLSVGVLALTISACVSSSDMYLAKNVSDEAKADFLYKQGVDNYEDLIVQKNDVGAISRVRKFFEHTLVLDPLHPQAQTYITRIDDYADRQFNRYMERAKKLQNKENRSATEEYDMVYAVARAGEIKSFDKDLLRLKMNTRKSRNAIVERRIGPLLVHEEKILAETNPKTLAVLVPEANRLMHSIDSVDPGNGTVKKTRATIGDHIGTLAQQDLENAKTHLGNKKYADAEASLIKAEKTVSGFDAPVKDEIAQLKYTVYMRWGTAHYDAGRFDAAVTRADQALAIQRTTEAVNLKAKSRQQASAPDYDGNISAIISGIDTSITKGNLLEAWDTCNANIPRMKQKTNQDKLAAKKTEILAALKPVYTAGIDAYNEEDYELAQDKFSQIVEIQATYEQAQAYLDRANSKLRALSGSN
jgi:tetratricopeptide (TPR) repeat protein